MHIILIEPPTKINDNFITGRNLLETVPIDTDIKHNLIFGDANDTRFSADFYQHIGLDIVTESVFNYPYPYLTEKTVRPIVEKRIFIIVGACGSIDLLHRRGFETFNDIINEDYDSIEDPELRLLAIVKEIEKFCQLSLDDIKNYYYKNKEKFNKNYKNLMYIKDKELERIKQLIDA